MASKFHIKNPETGEIIEVADKAGAQELVDSGGIQVNEHDFKVQKSQDSLVDTAAAAGIGLASGATFGLSSVGISMLPKEFKDYAKVVVEAHPTAETVGEIGGAIGAGLIGGPIGAPVRAVTALGEGVAAKAATKVGTGVFGKIASSAAQGAVEGSIYGAGASISDYALDDRPLTATILGSTILEGALTGAAFGGAANAAISAVGQGAKALYKTVVPTAENITGQPFIGGTSGNAKKMDMKFKETPPQEILDAAKAAATKEEADKIFSNYYKNTDPNLVKRVSEFVQNIESADNGNIFVKKDGTQVKDIFEMQQNANRMREEIGEKIHKSIMNDEVAQSASNNFFDYLGKIQQGKKIETEIPMFSEINIEDFVKKHIHELGMPEGKKTSATNLAKEIKAEYDNLVEKAQNELIELGVFPKLPKNVSAENIKEAQMQAVKPIANLQASFQMKEGLYRELDKAFDRANPTAPLSIEQTVQKTIAKKLKNNIVDAIEEISKDKSLSQETRNLISNFKKYNQDYGKLSQVQKSVDDSVWRKLNDKNTSVSAFEAIRIVGQMGGLMYSPMIFGTSLMLEASMMGKKLLKDPANAIKVYKYLGKEAQIKNALQTIASNKYVNSLGNAPLRAGSIALARAFTKDEGLEDFADNLGALDPSNNEYSQLMGQIVSSINLTKAIQTSNAAQNYLMTTLPQTQIDDYTGEKILPKQQELEDYAERVLTALVPENALRTLQEGNSLSPIQKTTLQAVHPELYQALKDAVDYTSKIKQSGSIMTRASRKRAVFDSMEETTTMLMRMKNFQPQQNQPSGKPGKSKTPSIAAPSDRLQK
jgi:hypothetical protein